VPTERIEDPSQGSIRRDHQIDRLVADALKLGGWNPDRIVIQSARMERHSESWVVIRIRFPDLYVWSANKAQKIHLTVEHAEKDQQLYRNARTVGTTYYEALTAWALARCGETTMLAYADWNTPKIMKAAGWKPWPKEFPTPLPYQIKTLQAAD
jgi:hypothetical protein